MTENHNKTIVPDDLTIALKIEEVTVLQKSAFAVQHLMAASRFSKQCGEVEKRHSGQPLGPFFSEQIACVSATIMLCVASLESNINEYLSESPAVLAEIAEHLKRDPHAPPADRLPVLKKYQWVLAIKRLPQFAKGNKPYQNVARLIALRNALVHFQPEWHHQQKQHKHLKECLKAKFELSPFITQDSGVFFPQRFVSHGCTKWAVQSSLTFMKDFSDRLGLSDKFAAFREKLVP